MEIQVAIDRVNLEVAKAIVLEIENQADIIEVGTSLIKDYGIKNCMEICNSSKAKILLDIKTIDEGDYEFNEIYRYGADIGTVMGAADIATIEKCRKMAIKYGKEYMIDLLGVSEDKIKELAVFKDAIFCVHNSKDNENNGGSFSDKIIKIRKILSEHIIYIAGSITPEKLSQMNVSDIQGIIVGSYITGNENKQKAFAELKKAMCR